MIVMNIIASTAAAIGVWLWRRSQIEVEQWREKSRETIELVCDALDQPGDDVPSLSAVGHVRRMRDHLEVLQGSHDVLFNRCCERRQEIIAKDTELIRVAKHSGDLQTEIAALQAENKRLADEVEHWTQREELAQRQFNQLLTNHDNIGASPAEQQAVEHDNIGTGHEWCANADCHQCNRLHIAMRRSVPRVRDDEAND